MGPVVVRGLNEVGSAVAHRLFTAGFPVILHDGPYPDANRRTVAFTDAVFDGEAELVAVRAVRVDDLAAVEPLLASHAAIPVLVLPLDAVLSHCSPEVLVDARMRKRSQPEVQRGLAPLTIGLGPNFVAGEITDLIVETGWGDDLGTVSDHGATRPLEGDPHPIDGHSRDRFIYAPVGGTFRTDRQIGQVVAGDEVIARIDDVPLRAPLPGMLRGLTHDGVPVARGTKVVEVDPRGAEAGVPRRMSTRPARIADGVLSAVQGWRARTGAAPTARSFPG